MKLFWKTALFSLFSLLVIGCSSSNSAWKRLPAEKLDQKSYAVGYSATAQSYADRVNESYEIDEFIRGADDWLGKRVALPIEQIRSSLLNRMLDHHIYAYYSGVLYAAELQMNFSRLSANCWSVIDTPSLTQGIFDAMSDLQRHRVREDDYLKQGAEKILHLCVEAVEKEQKTKPAKK